MVDFHPGQRNLLFGLASTFILAALGAAVFHVRWHAGAGPTELMGWMILIAGGVGSLTQLTLDSYTIPSRHRSRVFIGVAAGSVIMALTPFPVVEHLLKSDPTIGNATMFNLLFTLILAGAFVLAVAIYAVIEREVPSE